jgi:AbrB family looped-hinge helix DNA binding protein
MVVLTVQEDGQIQIPEAVCERLGIRPGTQLALHEGDGEGSIHLRVVPEEAQLVEKEGVWVVRSRSDSPEARNIDWLAHVREERIASLLEEG